MKRSLLLISVILIPLSFIFSQEEKKVLVEVFTNSHCPLCPPAHTVLNTYLAGPNGNKINYIFYHMVYPYQDDPLYQHNITDSQGRDDYYNPVHATPRGFFDGQIQSSTSGWASTLDNLVLNESPLNIILSGTKTEGSINIKAELIQTGEIPDNDLVIHFVVVENLNFTGRNGISYHKNVMRDMVDGGAGSSIMLSINDTTEIERKVTLDSEWIEDSVKVVVFVQSNTGKTVYQSAEIKYSDFEDPTGVWTEKNQPAEFKLVQNYPNPFNPSTTITYNIADESFVKIKIYNLLGKEISSLVNEKQSAGSYKYHFNGAGLSSGIYFYKLSAVNKYGKEFIQMKKMTLIK